MGPCIERGAFLPVCVFLHRPVPGGMSSGDDEAILSCAHLNGCCVHSQHAKLVDESPSYLPLMQLLGQVSTSTPMLHESLYLDCSDSSTSHKRSIRLGSEGLGTESAVEAFCPPPQDIPECFCCGRQHCPPPTPLPTLQGPGYSRGHCPAELL